MAGVARRDDSRWPPYRCRGFVQTRPCPAAPLVPEISLHLASEITPIWQATEAWLAEQRRRRRRSGRSPGRAARHWLATCWTIRPYVAGRRVLDFAAGCGIAAIACALAGAASVEAAEIDPLARRRDRAERRGESRVVGHAADTDVVGAACRWDLILCGDVCYEAPMTAHILPWLRAHGAPVPRSGWPIRAAPICRATGSRPLRPLSRADQPGTGGSHRAGGDALPAGRLTRLRVRRLALRLVAAELRQVDAVHRHRRSRR